MTPNPTTKGMSEAEVLATFDELTKGRFLWHGDIDMRVSARSTIESTFAELERLRACTNTTATAACVDALKACADTATKRLAAVEAELAQATKDAAYYKGQVDWFLKCAKVDEGLAKRAESDRTALLEVVRRLLPYARDQVSTYGREHCGAGKKAIAAAEAILQSSLTK